MLVLVAAVLTVLLVGALIYKLTSREDNLEVVGYVTSLRTHPLKSGGILHLNEAYISQVGIEHDRQFILLNQHGTFMTLRKHPRFVLIKQRICSDGIELSAEGMQPIKLPLSMERKDGDEVTNFKVFGNNIDGVHVSNEADKWLSDFLREEGCRLYCFPSDSRPRHNQEKGDVQANFCDDRDILVYADECPLLVLSEATVEKLNESLDRKVTVSSFRPNIVISGCKASEEDRWDLIKIGDTVLKGLYPCTRCVATTVDPYTGVKYDDGEPLNTIKRTNAAPGDLYPLFKGNPIFGFNYGVRRCGTIKVGQPVYRVKL